MAFLFCHGFLSNKSCLPKSTFLGSWDFGKKVQKGPTASKQIFSKGGGWILKVVGKFWRWWVNSEGVGYQRVFWVPLGGDDRYSSVVLHTAALNHKVAGSNPTPRGGEINHKSGRSIINQWINGIKQWKRSKSIKNGPKRSKKAQAGPNNEKWGLGFRD